MNFRAQKVAVFLGRIPVFVNGTLNCVLLKVLWAHAVISKKESCLFLMLRCLRPRRFMRFANYCFLFLYTLYAASWHFWSRVYKNFKLSYTGYMKVCMYMYMYGSFAIRGGTQLPWKTTECALKMKDWGTAIAHLVEQETHMSTRSGFSSAPDYLLSAIAPCSHYTLFSNPT